MNYALGVQNSPYFPRGWSVVSPSHKDRFVIEPSTTGNLGGTTTFTVPNNQFSYLAGPIELQFSTAPGTSDGGNNELLVEGFGLHAIETLTLKMGSQDLYASTGDLIRSIFYEDMNEEKANQVARSAGIPQDAVHAGDFLTGRRFTVQLDIPCGTRNALPMVMGSSLSVVVKWRQASDLLENGSAATVLRLADDTQKLICRGVYVPDDEQQALLALSNTADGIIMPIRQPMVVEKQVTLIAANTTQEFSVELKDFTLPVSRVQVQVHLDADLTTPYAKKYFDLQGEDVSGNDIIVRSWRIVDSAGTIISDMTPEEMLHEHYEHSIAPANTQIFMSYFNLMEQDPHNFGGSYNFSTSNNPKLYINIENLSSGPIDAFTLRLRVIGKAVNHWKLQGGQFRKFFSE